MSGTLAGTKDTLARKILALPELLSNFYDRNRIAGAR
jgi:hypothetical protein